MNKKIEQTHAHIHIQSFCSSRKYMTKESIAILKYFSVDSRICTENRFEFGKNPFNQSVSNSRAKS